MYRLHVIKSGFKIFLVLSMRFIDFHFQFHHSIQNRLPQLAQDFKHLSNFNFKNSECFLNYF